MSTPAAVRKRIRRALPTVLVRGVLSLPVLYATTCSYVAHRNTAAFNDVVVGDGEATVLRTLGTPSMREKRGEPAFVRYSGEGCVAPCHERLWYENRLGLDVEAWSIELGEDRRVIGTAHWVSP